MTSEFGTQFLGYVREMVNASAEHVKKDESDVEAVVSQVVNENWINPFDTRNTYIVSLSNGVAATPKIAEDLINSMIYCTNNHKNCCQSKKERRICES